MRGGTGPGGYAGAAQRAGHFRGRRRLGSWCAGTVGKSEGEVRPGDVDFCGQLVSCADALPKLSRRARTKSMAVRGDRPPRCR